MDRPPGSWQEFVAIRAFDARVVEIEHRLDGMEHRSFQNELIAMIGLLMATVGVVAAVKLRPPHAGRVRPTEYC